jgi:hypothetical protein
MQEQVVREDAQVAGSLSGSTADRPIARGAAGRNDLCQYGSGDLLSLQRLWLIMAVAALREAAGPVRTRANAEFCAIVLRAVGGPE